MVSFQWNFSKFSFPNCSVSICLENKTEIFNSVNFVICASGVLGGRKLKAFDQ